MEILRRYIIAALAAFSLTGCYKEIDIDDATTPVLCINSIIEAGEPFFVTASHTWIYSDIMSNTGEMLDVTVKDATIALYVNDEFVENLTAGTKLVESDVYVGSYSEYDGYWSTYAPKPGDRIHLVAESKDYGSAEATVTMPDEVPIDKLEYTVTTDNCHRYDMDSSIRISLIYTLDLYATFTDPKGTTNYYLADWAHGDRYYHLGAEDNNELDTEYTYGWLDDDVEPLFSEHISALESVFGAEVSDCYFFSDMQISGASYPLHLRIRNNRFWTSVIAEGTSYESDTSVKLYNISEEYYKYLVYAWQKDDGMIGMLQGVGFSDTLLGYSNVSTNAGIIAAMTPTTYTINLDEYFRDTIKQTLAE